MKKSRNPVQNNNADLEFLKSTILEILNPLFYIHMYVINYLLILIKIAIANSINNTPIAINITHNILFKERFADA